MDWDDLRYFLELARQKRLNQAGKKLGVDHTTVGRRIEMLETALGCRLFESTPSGYGLTDAGRRLLEPAEAIEGQVAVLRESALEHGSRVNGTVRVGTPEGFGTLFLTPRLPRLQEQHPELDVELLTLPRFPSLAAREADIVLTLDPPQHGRYMTARLTDFTYGLYATPSYLARHAPIRTRAQLAGHRFVGYLDDMLPTPQFHYLEALVPGARPRFTSSGMLAQVAAVRADMGLAILAHYMAGPDLVPVLPREATWKHTFWLTTHVDWFRLRRVRAVWDFMRRAVEAERGLFMARPAREVAMR